MLWAVYWPTDGTIGDLIKPIKVYLQRIDEASDVFLIFDRYFDYSPKGATRQSCVARLMKNHEFFLETLLLAQKSFLRSYFTKEKLISLIVHDTSVSSLITLIDSSPSLMAFNS